MCAKNHLLIFNSFLDIWENVEWPRFFGPPCISVFKIHPKTPFKPMGRKTSKTFFSLGARGPPL